MLPWDDWGCMVDSDDEIDEAYMDELAKITVAGTFADITRAYEDERVRMPGKVLTMLPTPHEESVEVGAP
jgi:hypothetical protein